MHAWMKRKARTSSSGRCSRSGSAIAPVGRSGDPRGEAARETESRRPSVRIGARWWETSQPGADEEECFY